MYKKVGPVYTLWTCIYFEKTVGPTSLNMTLVNASFHWIRWNSTMTLLQCLPQSCRNSPAQKSWPHCLVSSGFSLELWQHHSAIALTWMAAHLCVGPVPIWEVMGMYKSFSMKKHNRYVEKVLCPCSYILASETLHSSWWNIMSLYCCHQKKGANGICGNKLLLVGWE